MRIFEFMIELYGVFVILLKQIEYFSGFSK